MAQMNVNLAFSADTGKAKAQIAELQSLLSKIAYTGSTANATNVLQKDLQEASTAAKELQFHLNNAFNVSTGKFDLSMLDKSLKTSNANITDLSTKLLGAGATGQQAFATLAQSISLADQPMLRVSKRMQDFAVTMKNTVKWQLSSSMLHGFMGAIQSAYGYAQDLNKSLTDIRIVTGYSADQMAQFAEQANKAAKALSTTTTDYTNASLIYFQQGLSDAEVAARTDITVKMANAAGQSAEVVSEQLTAVWNNFADGSKSLEYYADVMTALGAATASSSDEISEGLSKFSAVAESVGLSYEYATAALTTITSNTRESADIVGNALKTLFARIQGLKLGETLEDGVDLNKYSEALDKVGISIFQQNGELKAMDTILDEMAAKWGTLSNTQQVALAQTVAGVRQYNQLIALMENWNNGDEDSMMANLKTIENADGALQKQADIYADSWEAAQKRVQASAEGIYQSLIDDDFFISINNGFANLLGGLDAFIDGAGGVKTVLTGISSVIITSFANKIPEALNTFRYNLEIVTKGSQAAYDRIQKDMNTATQDAFTKFNTSMGSSGIQKDSAIGFAIEQANELTAARNKLALISDKMSTAEKQSAEIQLNLIKAQQDEVVSIREKNEQLQESIRLQQEQIRRSQTIDNSRNKTLKSSEDMSNMYLSYNDTLIELEEQRNRLIDTINQRSARGQDTTRQEDNLTRINAEIEQYEALSYAALGFSDNYKAAMQVLNTTNNTIGQELFNIFSQENFDTALRHPIRFAEELGIAFDQIEETLTDINLDFDDKLNLKTVKDQIKALQSTIPEIIQSATGLDIAFNRVFTANDADELEQAFLALRLSINNCTLEGTDFQRVLEGLYGRPITQISADMQKYAQGTEQAIQKTATLKKLLEEFKPEHTVRISEAMGSLAGLMGNVVTIGNSLKSMLQSLGDPDLSGWEKFSAVLTGLSVLIPTVLSSLQAAATINEFLSKSYGKSAIAIGIDTAAKTISTKVTTALGIANTGLVASMGPLLVIIGAVAAALLILAGIVKLITIAFEAWKASTPEGKLEAAKEATEAMATAAQDATTAYQNLLNTISGYDSAVAALENLEVGTQEFTNALITANEKAWELIDAYGLIQGADWDYGENGEIIIKQSSKDRITKEANDIREDAVIAQSVAQLQEKEAAYNVSRSNAGMVGYDIQQGYLDQNVLYDALGLTNGSFKHTKDAIQQWQEEGIFNADVADKIAQSLYGVDWLDLDNNQLEYINNNIFKYLDEIETMFGDFSQYNSAKENQFDKQVSIVMSDEEAYQKTSWKGAVNDYLESSFESAKQEALAEYEGKTDDQINAAYEDYLKKTYIEEDGKYYRKDASGNKTGEAIEGLTGLSPEAQKDILATVDAWQVLEDKGVEMAQSFNGIANDMTDSEKDVADALLNGDLNSLTEEQIEAFKSGELSLEEAIGSSNYQQLAALLGEDYIQQLEQGFSEAVSNYTPPEFDVEAWKSDYTSKVAAVGEIDEYGNLDAKNYALLADEYSEYFNVQADGTARLKKSAEEFKAIVEGIELGELKEEIADLQAQKENITEDSGRSETELDSAAQSWTDMYNSGTMNEGFAQNRLNTDFVQSMAEGLDIDIGDYESAAAALNAIGEAWINLQNTLNNNQQTMADTANSLQELDAQLETGAIDIEEYNEAFDSVIAKEAELNDLDYESILDFAKYLQESNEELKDNEKLCKKIALSYHRWDKGVKTISENFEDWSKNIKNVDKNSKTYINTIKQMKNAYKDVFSEIDPDIIDQLSDEFLTSKENLSLLEQGLKGNEQAWNDWEAAVLQEISSINPAFANVSAEMKAQMNDLVIAAANLDFSGLTPGASIDDSDFNAKLNAMVFNTAEAAQAMCNNLSAVGVDAEIEEHTQEVPGYTAETVQSGSFSFFDEANKQVGTVSFTGGATETKQPHTETFYTLKGATYNGKGVGAGGGGYKGNSGGGGGGGSKPKHAEKKNDSDKERYHTLNNQLEDLESQYDSISDAADRAFGQDKLDNLDKQIEKTQELIDKNEEYLAEAEKNASIDKSVMEAYYNKSIGGPVIQYDENGNITNFDEIQDAAYAKYNQMAETYDEESNEWIQFEKDYEQFMKYLELYEESTDLVRDKKAEAERLAAEKIDLELEKVQYSIEIQLEVPEDQLKVIDFQLERIEDDAFNSAESMNLLIQKANLFNREIETTKQGLIDTLGVTLSDQEINQILSGDMDSIDTSKFTEDQVSAIREYKDSLLELNQELLDIQQQIEDEVMETFEEYHEELDRGMEKFDHYNNMLESYQNIVDIVGKDVLGLDNEALADISEAQVENSINQLKASKDAYDSLQKQADDALQKQQEAEMKAALARAKGDEEIAKSYEEDAEFWKETYTEMNEAAVEAQEEMMDNWGNTLEAIATQFELAVERAVEAFNDAIYEFGGLEGMSDDFSRQKEMDDMYLEDYQQIYELSKLTRDINNTIDDTENIAGKQKLKKLLEEINQLQEDGVEMSEYDLEYLQAEYNLRLAELELEEAQKAKDTVRLSRDNEGNWSYVYTQNTDAVDAAQQKYEDALYAMQDLSSNYIDEMSEQLIATSQEMQEALANVRVEDFASQEEYYAELARIEAQYQEQMAAQEAELNKAIANNKELYDTDWKNYSEATGYKISKAEEFATKFSDTLLGSLVGSEEATSNFTAIVGEATDSLVQGLANAAATYYTNLNTAMEAAGTSTSEFADLLAEDVEAIKTDSKEAADAVADMAKKMDEEMTKITERVQKFQEDYGREIDKIIAKNLEMVETFNDMLEHLSIDPDQINVTYDISRAQDGEGGETVEVPEGTASGYTGMYTGDWGSNEGRVAVLHEKELLLNQDDTVNMLEALKISKYMLEILNANTQMMSQGMGSLFPASVDNSVSEILEQQVSIVAEFPNAVNHSEIEEAFDTLINRAAQYANRK